MFSGIVEEYGSVEEVVKKENLYVLRIKVKKVLGGTKIGDSICVNGVCLTVTQKTKSVLSFDLMKETLEATTLKHAKNSFPVNLERSLKVSDRLGGHFVTGHVDGVGVIKEILTLPNYVEFRIKVDRALLKYIAPKGSVAVDGVSLTIGRVTNEYFSIYLIPHTLEVTTFGKMKAADEVNIETDILAKYILKDRE
jgi:riboflavin synthase